MEKIETEDVKDILIRCKTITVSENLVLNADIGYRIMLKANQGLDFRKLSNQIIDPGYGTTGKMMIITIGHICLLRNSINSICL